MHERATIAALTKERDALEGALDEWRNGSIAAHLEAELDALAEENRALRVALERLANWPSGGNSHGQSNMQKFARVALARRTENASES